MSLSEASKSNVETFTNGSLIINAVKNENAGSYECEITNSVGVGLRKKIRISVSGMPKYVLPQIFYKIYKSRHNLFVAYIVACLFCIVCFYFKVVFYVLKFNFSISKKSLVNCIFDLLLKHIYFE